MRSSTSMPAAVRSPCVFIRLPACTPAAHGATRVGSLAAAVGALRPAVRRRHCDRRRRPADVGEAPARWGRPIVIENRPGADGLLAINAFISANDDHVLLYASTASFMAHPYTLDKMPYNLDRDFAPIARVTDTVLVGRRAVVAAGRFAQGIRRARQGAARQAQRRRRRRRAGFHARLFPEGARIST